MIPDLPLDLPTDPPLPRPPVAGPLDHWHPVLLDADLKSAPVPITLLGLDYVLFRASSGAIGCLRDRCPHRGLPLSCGHVEGDRLHCVYHGWRFETEGRGQSPGSPDLRVTAEGLEAVSRHGAIWVRRRGAATAFPRFDLPDHRPIARIIRRVDVPLLLALDNFCEVEHTPTTHALFGYDIEHLAEVTAEVTHGEGWVRVVNRGPQKALPRPLYPLFALKAGDTFIDDWTTRFSPVHCVYDQYWEDPATGAARPERLRLFVFFTPVTETTTDLVTLAYGRSTRAIPPPLRPIPEAVLRVLLTREIDLDVALLGRFKAPTPSLKGLNLGRFDRALLLNRRQLKVHYEGEGGGGGMGKGRRDKGARPPMQL